MGDLVVLRQTSANRRMARAAEGVAGRGRDRWAGRWAYFLVGQLHKTFAVFPGRGVQRFVYVALADLIPSCKTAHGARNHRGRLSG